MFSIPSSTRSKRCNNRIYLNPPCKERHNVLNHCKLQEKPAEFLQVYTSVGDDKLSRASYFVIPVNDTHE